MWLYLAIAVAEIPLPAYDDALARGEWYALNNKLDATCRFDPRAAGVSCSQPELLDEVIERAAAWQKTVQPDAGLTYLEGLAWRYKGDQARARARWEAAVEIDPDYRAPWYDLGELYLASGELDEAAEAFEHVGRLTAEGPEEWLASWRLAEVAAFRGDAAAFEAHMRDALRHGFRFDQVVGLPNWKAFLRDPRIGPSVEKLITVYGTPRDLQRLNAP